MNTEITEQTTEIMNQEDKELQDEKMKGYWANRGKEERRFRALTSLLNFSTIAEAARNCELDRRTFYNYLRDPEFQEALEDMKKAQIDKRRDQLHDLADSAERVISDLFTQRVEDTYITKYTKLNPIIELRINAALRILSLANVPPVAPSPSNEVSAAVSVPPGGRAVAVAMAENFPEM